MIDVGFVATRERLYDIQRDDKWYDHKSEGVIENERAKIHCDHHIEHRKPDIVLIEKESKLCRIIDIACPADNKVCDTEGMKKDRYDRFAFEIKQLWSIKK